MPALAMVEHLARLQAPENLPHTCRWPPASTGSTRLGPGFAAMRDERCSSTGSPAASGGGAMELDVLVPTTHVHRRELAEEVERVTELPRG